MSGSEHDIVVRTHIARDFLQNAGVFKTDKLVAWEYVSNGLQYVDPGVNPVVRVKLDNKCKSITIVDNGRGMNWRDLSNFFIMHGENIDRREGRPGRGRFGTGKCAAFGIAEKLRITSIRDRKRSRVELCRAEIVSMKSEAPIPVRTIEKEVMTTEVNGTKVEIEGIHLKSIDQPGIIHYIERHLARWPKNATVWVNHHPCEFTEPPVASRRTCLPNEDTQKIIGDCQLILKVSKVHLEEELRGISIFSNGIWHETTLAGSEGRDMCQFIFGEIDVPKLDEDESLIPPYDMTRSLKLNPSNALVQMVMAFIGKEVDALRRELVEEDNKRRASEEAKRFKSQADQIARLINEDFDEFRHRLAKVKAKAEGGGDTFNQPSAVTAGNDDLIFGAEVAAEVVSETGGPGHGAGSARGGEEPPPMGPQVVPGGALAEKQGKPVGGDGGQRRPKGGFRVEFKRMGSESPRAKYVSEERTIYVNLDHPQIDAAKGSGSVDDLSLRRLVYEVAFSEYSVALAQELASRDEYLEPSEPIYDIRQTLDRMARKAASLYSN